MISKEKKVHSPYINQARKCLDILYGEGNYSLKKGFIIEIIPGIATTSEMLGKRMLLVDIEAEEDYNEEMTDEQKRASKELNKILTEYANLLKLDGWTVDTCNNYIIHKILYFL